jgi:flagellin
MLIFGSGTNASAIANRSLQLANAAVYSSIEKLSSGSRITAASDDAGGLAVQVKMVAAFNRLGALKNNLINALSYKQVQEDSLKQIGDLLARMSELKTFSLDPTKTASDLSDYATEYSALASQIRKISRSMESDYFQTQAPIKSCRLLVLKMERVCCNPRFHR